MDKSLILKGIAELLSSRQQIVITVHTNPDGDAIGSALAFGQFLQKLDHDVHIIAPNHFPEFLAWLPGADEILVFEQDVKGSRAVLAAATLVFCLDYNALHRSGSLQDDLFKLTVPRILIDHHREPELDAFLWAYSDTRVSSTAELIYEFIAYYDFDKYIDNAIAQALFTGIMTDTGSFSYAINQAETLEIAAKLVRSGLDAVWVHQQVYDTFSENRLRLLGHAISNCMLVFEEFSTAIIQLSKEDLQKFHFQIGDTEGIVNYPLQMKNIKMAVLITEKKDTIRFSFRSKGSFSVHEVAKAYFNGGGHANAAGGSLKTDMSSAVKQLIDVLPEYKAILDSSN